MKKLSILFAILAAAWMTAGCQKDGDTIYVGTPTPAQSIWASDTEIVLLAENADNLALTLTWEAVVAPEVSNPDVALPDDMIRLRLQIAADAEFATVAEQILDPEQISCQYTHSALNTLMYRLGFADDQMHAIYLRLVTTMGDYTGQSEVLMLNVTPYVDVAASGMIMQDVNGVPFAALDCKSPDTAPNLFEGFAVTSQGWFNFYFVAVDGTVWGNDGDTGTPFMISSSDTKWNCWFADTSGCHYVYVDTDAAEWWEIHMPTLTATVEGTAYELKFSTSKKTWTGTVTSASDNAALVISGMGVRYDVTTGTDAAAAIECPYALVAGSNGKLGFEQGGTQSNMSVAQAGTYTLTLDMDALSWSMEGNSGEEEPPVIEYPEALYAYYYNNAEECVGLATALAAQMDEGIYEGFVYTDPDWADGLTNFMFHTSTDDTATVYGGDGEQFLLTDADGKWRLWSASPGLNYVVVDLTTMSWTETPVTHFAVAGDFNSWALTTDLFTFDKDTHVWGVTCDITDIGWGIQFVLGTDDTDNAWRWIYASSATEGVLALGGQNIYPESTGTYRIEVNLNSYASPAYTLVKTE